MIGYISDNLLIPILDFFYGLVPSYGLAIVALTLVIRIALYPLSAGSIRSARRMRIAQPVIQKRQAEIKSRYACLLYTSPSPRDRTRPRMPSSA